MSAWSAWVFDPRKNITYPLQWHAYRARLVDGDWEYDTQAIDRVLVGQPHGWLDYLRAAALQESAVQSMSEELNRPVRNEAPTGQQRASVSNWLQTVTEPSVLTVQRSKTPPVETTMARESLVLPFRQRGQGQASKGDGDIAADWRLINRSGARTVAPGGSRRPHDPHPSGLGFIDYQPVKSRDRKEFFKVGRVFSRPYVRNPAGESASEMTYADHPRYIVLRNNAKHSICVAYHGYTGRGTVGRRADHHLIIYSVDPPAGPAFGEDQAILNHPSIKVLLERGEHNLRPDSRLNLVNLYSIDHCVPVHKIGKVGQRAAEQIRAYCLALRRGDSSDPLVRELRGDDAQVESSKGKSRR